MKARQTTTNYFAVIIFAVIIAVIVALNIAFWVSSTYAASQEHEFSDIKGHWAESVIKVATEKGYVNGYPDGTFRPNDRVNINEFVVMTVRSLTEKFSNGRTGWANAYFDKLNYGRQLELIYRLDEFDPNDPPQYGQWDTPYLDQAEWMGFFRKNDSAWGHNFGTPIKRGEAIYVIMALIHTIEHIENDALLKLVDEAFTDVAESIYAHQIRTSIIKGIITGYPDKTFREDGYITRAEAVVIVNRILDETSRAPYKPDLSNKPHIIATLPNGAEKTYVVPAQEYIDVLEKFEEVKGMAPGHHVGTGTHFSIYNTTKEAYDEYVRKVYTRSIKQGDRINQVIDFGLGNNDMNYRIVRVLSEDFTEYEELFAEISTILFEDEAQAFIEWFNAVVSDTNNGFSRSETKIINNREVMLSPNSNRQAVSADISQKR